MLGAIIGDIVGSRFELNNYQSKEFDLFSDDCFVTDDSIMTLAVAKAIIETEKIIERGVGLFQSEQKFYGLLSEHAVQYMQEIGRKYPDCGYGGMFGRWVFSEDPKPYNSFGNGAAMRVSPVGFFARDEFEISTLSKAVTAVTHNHEEGLKGAEATALATYMARAGSLKEEIQKEIESEFYQLDFTIDEIRGEYKFNETCQGTVPQAIKCFLESESFEDAIRIAISLGGDSDTIAAITGAVAAAYYGVPEAIKRKALSYLNDDLLEIYMEWATRASVTDNGCFWALTKYIGRFSSSDPYGHWRADEDVDGSQEDQFVFPWSNYNLFISSFIVEVNQFAMSHPEYRPYMEVLERHGIKWDHNEMREVDIERLDEECLLALIVAAVRAEKFSDGAVMRFLKEGCIQKWLKKLRDLDPVGEQHRCLAELQFSLGGYGIPEDYHLILADKRSYLIKGFPVSRFETYSELKTEQLRAAWYDLHTEYWRYSYPQEGDYFILDGMQWTLKVRYAGGFWRAYHGDNRFPENWEGLLNLLGIKNNYEDNDDDEDEDDDDDEDGEDDGDSGGRQPGEVIYCKVSFNKYGSYYSYLTDDESISVGDSVEVPVGDDNIKRIGIVESVDCYKPENVPYPLDKVKKIIRRLY